MRLVFTLLTAIFATQAIAQNQPTDSSEAINFALVESLPVYKGCDENASKDSVFACLNSSIMSFIGANFVYPEKARQKGIEGRVFVNFVVEKDGSVSNVQIARGVHKLLDEEAVRVIKKIPRFVKPAFQRGKTVRMQYTVPINAKLN